MLEQYLTQNKQNQTSNLLEGDKKKQLKERQQLANLHLNAGRSVIVSNQEPDFSQHPEPSGSKQFLVFGGALGPLVGLHTGLIK